MEGVSITVVNGLMVSCGVHYESVVLFFSEAVIVCGRNKDPWLSLKGRDTWFVIVVFSFFSLISSVFAECFLFYF